MNAPDAFSFDDQSASTQFVIRDTVLTARRVLAHLHRNDPAAIQASERFLEQGEREGRSLWDILSSQSSPVSTKAMAVLLEMWCAGAAASDESERSGWDNALVVIEMVWSLGEDGDAEDDRLLRDVLDLLLALGELPGAGDQTEAVREACGHCRKLDERMRRRNDLALSMSCAQSAANLAGLLPLEESLAFANSALALARQIGDNRYISIELMRRALVLCRLAKAGGDWRAQAFDGVEAALRFFQVEPAARPRNEMALVLGQWVFQSDFLHGLRPLTAIVFPDAVQVNLPPDVRSWLETLAPISELDMKEWGSRVLGFNTYAVEIENARLALFPPLEAIQAEAYWASASFTHPRLHRAVPHSQSILKDSRFPDLLLEVSHETTHILSMTGELGAALSCFRFAHFEREFTAWMRRGKPLPTDDLESVLGEWRPARPDDATPLGLTLAEQAVVLERKIQILQRIWMPWFEGLALLGELQSDPTMSGESFSPLAGVTVHLRDRFLDEMSKELRISRSEAAGRCWKEAEEKISQVQMESGGLRLNAYLGDYRGKYLAGYLTVRSVVASWRAVLQRPLSGADAFEVLLHATRFTAFEEMIPDPSVPLDQFAAEAIQRQCNWITNLVNVSPEDLDKCINTYARGASSSGWRWERGRFVESVVNAEVIRKYEARFAKLIEKFREIAIFDHAAPHGNDGSDEIASAVLRACAEALQERSSAHALPTQAGLNLMSEGKAILPIAQDECPFWLLKADKRVVILLRTRQESSDTGKPSYNNVVMPLDDESFALLESEVRRGGEGRMRVTRVAAMVSENPLMQGVHYMVYRYGTWELIQQHGIGAIAPVTSSRVIRWIHERLLPSGLAKAVERASGEDHPGARATRDWISNREWNVEMQGIQVDLRPRASAVVRVAEQVLDVPEDSDTAGISRALLELVYGEDAIVSRLIEQGLHVEGAPGLFSRTINALHATGRAPVDTNEVAQTAQELQENDLPLLRRSALGWDVPAAKCLKPLT